MATGRAMHVFQALALAGLLSLGPVSAWAAAIHLGNGTEPESLDIHQSSGVSEANIQRDLFEGLIAEGPDASLIPGAAESWEISEDGMVYTFHLREDGRWSNGDPVTAGDFVYAFRRGLAPETAAAYAFILYPVLNAEQYVGGEITDPEAVGIRAIDERTLEITLKAPTAYFLDMLTHHMAYPLHQASIEAHPDDWMRPGNLVSNGAYTLAEWAPQSHIRLARNPQYHDAEAVALDEVWYYPTEDVGQELQRYRAGELDVTYDIPADQVAWIEANLAAEYRNFPYLGTYYYVLNTTVAPFADNIPLRQALALAIDREVLTQKITRAGEIPAYSFVPPGVMHYEQQTQAFADWSQEERNAQARELYAEAGYGADTPLQIEILYNTSDNHKKIAIAISAMWKQTLGVETTLRNEEWKVYLSSRDEKNFQVVRAAWIGDYNDANTFLELFVSDAGEMNDPGYDSARYDELVKGGAFETDLAARQAMMEEAERVFLADTPLIPIYFYTTQHMVKPGVEGWIDNIKDVHPSHFLSVGG
ncbi:MAG: peptide ABC transporter substrate-binding protein [Proteobacteria bacterium]|nr:peptide ABC transporter substrate-binding protein [Pseudomonadota bacterium]